MIQNQTSAVPAVTAPSRPLIKQHQEINQSKQLKLTPLPLPKNKDQSLMKAIEMPKKKNEEQNQHIIIPERAANTPNQSAVPSLDVRKEQKIDELKIKELQSKLI